MAFRASNILPQRGYNQARAIALDLKSYCASKAADIQANGDDTGDLLGILAKLTQASADFNEIAAIPGIAEYAISQEDDPLYDVVAEFQALVAVIGIAVAALAAAFPRDVDGKLLIATMPTDSIVYDVYGPAALAFLVSDLTDIDNAIV